MSIQNRLAGAAFAVILAAICPAGAAQAGVTLKMDSATVVQSPVATTLSLEAFVDVSGTENAGAFGTLLLSIPDTSPVTFLGGGYPVDHPFVFQEPNDLFVAVQDPRRLSAVGIFLTPGADSPILDNGGMFRFQLQVAPNTPIGDYLIVFDREPTSTGFARSDFSLVPIDGYVDGVVRVVAIPEPATGALAALLGAALLGLAVRRRSRQTRP